MKKSFNYNLCFNWHFGGHFGFWQLVFLEKVFWKNKEVTELKSRIEALEKQVKEAEEKSKEEAEKNKNMKIIGRLILTVKLATN